MPININLLPDIKPKDEQKKSLIRKLNIVFILVAVLSLLIGGGVFFVTQTTASNLEEIKSEVNAQEQIIAQEVEIEKMLFGLKSHASAIDQILRERKEYSVFLTKFGQYVPQSITISDLTIDSSGEVTLNGEAPSYEKLAGFMLILSGEESTEEDSNSEETLGDPFFSNISLRSVSRREESAIVRFTISMTAEKEAFDE